jgi:hypothetical protein
MSGAMCFADLTDVVCPWAQTHGHQCQLDTGHESPHECGCGHQWGGPVAAGWRRMRYYKGLRRLLVQVRSRPRNRQD